MLAVLGCRAWRDDLLDIGPEDFSEPRQDGVAVDAAPAAFHLGQPGLRPADQACEHGLGQAPASPGPRDPLPGRLQVRHVPPVRAPAGRAAVTSLHGGSRRSYGAPGSNRTRTPISP